MLSTENAALCLLTNFGKSALLVFASIFLNVSICTINVSICHVDATSSSLMGVIPALYSHIAWTCICQCFLWHCMASNAPCTTSSSSRVERWMRVYNLVGKGLLNRVPPQSLVFLSEALPMGGLKCNYML